MYLLCLTLCAGGPPFRVLTKHQLLLEGLFGFQPPPLYVEKPRPLGASEESSTPTT